MAIAIAVAVVVGICSINAAVKIAYGLYCGIYTVVIAIAVAEAVGIHSINIAAAAVLCSR